MALAWSDLGGTSAQEVSYPVFQCPFDGVAAAYVLSSTWQQPTASYSPLALNTPHPTYTSYLLVKETGFKDIGGGQQQWTRIYAQTPSQRIELSTMNYNFIGFYGPRPPSEGATDPGTAYGRFRKVHFVLVKHQFDYYLVDGTIITSQYGIPVIDETKYLGPTFGGVTSQIEVDYLWDTSMPGGITFALASNPSLTTYKGWMSTDAGTASSFSIVSQGSSVRRWMGNIWERETLYIKAI